MTKNSTFIHVTDIQGSKHLINVSTIAQITETIGSGSKIQLTANENGSAITIYTNDPLEKLKMDLENY